VDEILEGLRDHAEPCVLLGDFNLHERLPVDQQTAARLHDAGWVDTAANDRTHVMVNERFDRIFVRDSDKKAWVREPGDVEPYGSGPRKIPFLSDHLPVEATLSLVDRAA
jgi:endonuclease/exonuclease/phosphatase family metal-dependent hydrolase